MLNKYELLDIYIFFVKDNFTFSNNSKRTIKRINKFVVNILFMDK